ncbi:TetR/AcrR family transcriptional regulator [Mycetocola spongiae]|uniref:TetR/AcrR family transcriptional regulator n=1 Tax=Mycetocola spongiae TaxID=2859226 RepID=UPI001CF313F3|nr:TetR/AcrR family transcriptional regulator [Mycetocola spongiae]UCR88433.1 TetR/AcrR family transcriptional regulator [Mycetocola spongiae]
MNAAQDPPATAAQCAPAEPGLRERKRAATQLKIEKIAVALAETHGYEHVTVEMICEEAMVSPRTLFNYFGTKEGVFLGPTPPMPAPEVIEGFIHGRPGSVLGDLVEIFRTLIVGTSPDIEFLHARRALIHSTPDLAVRELARMGGIEKGLTKLILARYRAEGRTDEDLANEARMVIALAAGVMRTTMHRWLDDPQNLDPSELFAESIQLIRRITGDAPSG